MKFQDWCKYIGNDTADNNGEKVERARCICGWEGEWQPSYREAFLSFARHSKDFYDPMYEETVARSPLYQVLKLSQSARQ